MGADKSRCYQLPALRLKRLTLVVSSLIALMKDQVDALKVNGTAADLLNSQQPSDRPTRIRQGALGSSLKILYVNPERFADKCIQSFLARLHINSLASLL